MLDEMHQTVMEEFDVCCTLLSSDSESDEETSCQPLRARGPGVRWMLQEA